MKPTCLLFDKFEPDELAQVLIHPYDVCLFIRCRLKNVKGFYIHDLLKLTEPSVIMEIKFYSIGPCILPYFDMPADVDFFLMLFKLLEEILPLAAGRKDAKR